jgi:AcrR family transcriptional regulator
VKKKPKSSLRRLSRDERKAQFLGVALDLFAARGYHATSISHIIDKAGVARGTFYQHFKSKKEIFDQLLDQLFDQVNSHVIPIRITTAGEIAGAVRANLEALCRVLQENLPMARVLLEQAVGLNEAGREQMRAFYGRVLDRVDRAVIVGQQLGIIRAGDPSLISICLVGMVKEPLYQQIAGVRTFKIETLVDEIFACVERGVLSTTVPAAAR